MSMIMDSIPSQAEKQRQPLLGYDQDELKAILSEMGLPSFRAQQLWSWVWRHGITDFNDMTNIAKDTRARLAEAFHIDRPAISRRQDSIDGTIKWLIETHDKQLAEMVYIPDDDRGTLCISSQIGCTLNCSFCHTGTQRLVRNLDVAEIAGQVLLAMDELGDWPATRPDRRLTNIVLMGMGEPLYNYQSVAKAMRIIMSGDGVGLSKRRITLSTSGIVPEIEKCGAELGVNLAISLHAVRDDLRDILVPINRKYDLAELVQAVRDYPGLSNARRVTWEYVMIKGVNDTEADARQLVQLIKGIPSKINLIPFNPWPGTDYECSDPQQIDKFAAIVMRAGYASPVRTPRGRDILAACGQLKSDSVRLRKSQMAEQQKQEPQALSAS
ncbi:MAG: 23S rRNA (adenine(2503)-C(2))-methyltransferase RlmN [Candidatus Puniceispirillaceae bacterium]